MLLKMRQSVTLLVKDHSKTWVRFTNHVFCYKRRDGLNLKTTRKIRCIKYPWLRAGEVILYYLIDVEGTGKET